MEPNDQSAIQPMPRIGDKAPAFRAVTTQGEIDFPKQYEGSWVILFSHPADFTPVCTSEFMTFATMEQKFAELNCKLVGFPLTASTATSPGSGPSRRRSSTRA